jgi:tetratricopeptide (TPR) repeat protein
LTVAALVALRAVRPVLREGPPADAPAAHRGEDGLVESQGDVFPEPVFSPQATAEDLKREARRVAAWLAEDFPNEPDALDVRARVESRFGALNEAGRLWEKCLSLRADFAPAYDGLGRVANLKGDFDKAVPLLRKAVQLAPDDRDYPIDLAQSLLGANQFQEAVVRLKQFMQSGPMTAVAALYLGQACLELNELEGARQAFEITLQAAPDDGQAHFGLAQVYRRLRQPAKAQLHADQFQRNSPAARAGARQGTHDAGSPTRVRDISVRVHNESADFYQKHGNPRRAEELWRRAAVLDPKDLESRSHLAALYEQSHRDRDALQVCRQLRQIEPDQALRWLNVGLLEIRLNRVEEGLAAVERAFQLDPADPRCRQAHEAAKQAMSK